MKPKSDQSQGERFAAMARKLGADEREAAFREKLAVIARQQPKDDVPEVPTDKPAKPGRKPKAG